jgi:hypothetical protein
MPFRCDRSKKVPRTREGCLQVNGYATNGEMPLRAADRLRDIERSFPRPQSLDPATPDPKK